MFYERAIKLLFVACAVLALGPAASASPDDGKKLSKPASCAKLRSEEAVQTQDDQVIRRLSLAGLSCAQNCAPDDAPCFYWRAVNRGRLLETNLANPKDHLPSLIADFETAARLDSSYDDAGALRALGTIFLKLPAVSLWGEGYARDLDKARSYARSALKIAGRDHENLRLAGEIAFTEKDFQSARDYFKKSLTALRKSDEENPVQKTRIQSELERWLRKSERKLAK